MYRHRSSQVSRSFPGSTCPHYNTPHPSPFSVNSGAPSYTEQEARTWGWGGRNRSSPKGKRGRRQKRAAVGGLGGGGILKLPRQGLGEQRIFLGRNGDRNSARGYHLRSKTVGGNPSAGSRKEEEARSPGGRAGRPAQRRRTGGGGVCPRPCCTEVPHWQLRIKFTFSWDRTPHLPPRTASSSPKLRSGPRAPPQPSSQHNKETHRPARVNSRGGRAGRAERAPREKQLRSPRSPERSFSCSANNRLCNIWNFHLHPHPSHPKIFNSPLLSNWELRWMRFLPSPDGWRLRLCFGNPTTSLSRLLFLQGKYKESWSGGEICDRESPWLPPSPPSASLWLVPIQQQIEAGDDSSQGLFSSFTSRRRLHEPSDVNQQGFSLSPLSNNESCC